MSEKLAMVIKDDVIGIVFDSPPIIRMSCSLFKL